MAAAATASGPRRSGERPAQQCHDQQSHDRRRLDLENPGARAVPTKIRGASMPKTIIAVGAGMVSNFRLNTMVARRPSHGRASAAMSSISSCLFGSDVQGSQAQALEINTIEPRRSHTAGGRRSRRAAEAPGAAPRYREGAVWIQNGDYPTRRAISYGERRLANRTPSRCELHGGCTRKTSAYLTRRIEWHSKTSARYARRNRPGRKSARPAISLPQSCKEPSAPPPR